MSPSQKPHSYRIPSVLLQTYSSHDCGRSRDAHTAFPPHDVEKQCGRLLYRLHNKCAQADSFLPACRFTAEDEYAARAAATGSQERYAHVGRHGVRFRCAEVGLHIRSDVRFDQVQGAWRTTACCNVYEDDGVVVLVENVVEEMQPTDAVVGEPDPVQQAECGQALDDFDAKSIIAEVNIAQTSN